MGKPTYDELTRLYKDCELQRETLIFKNEDLKDRIIKAIEYIKNYYFYNSLDFDVKELLDILKGSDE